MSKDVGELLLDALVYTAAFAERKGEDELANIIAELYQVAGEVIYQGHDLKIESPCALSILKKIEDEV